MKFKAIYTTKIKWGGGGGFIKHGFHDWEVPAQRRKNRNTEKCTVTTSTVVTMSLTSKSTTE